MGRGVKMQHGQDTERRIMRGRAIAAATRHNEQIATKKRERQLKKQELLERLASSVESLETRLKTIERGQSDGGRK